MFLSASLRPLVAAGLLAAAALAPGRAAAEAPAVPVAECDAATVLYTVRSSFAHGAARVEKDNLEIAEFGTIRSQGAGVNDPSPIPRRWCYAPVKLSDGTRSTAYWRIDDSAGFASPGLFDIHDRIEVCVLGRDRWRVHDGTCRTVRRWW